MQFIELTLADTQLQVRFVMSSAFLVAAHCSCEALYDVMQNFKRDLEAPPRRILNRVSGKSTLMASCRRFEGKVVLVTAATAGIGFGIAQRLGEEGAKLVICSRKQNNVDDTLKTLKDKGIQCVGCVCHVGNREHIKNFVKLAMETYGQIDVLVSNAAVNPASGPLLSIPESAIDKTLEINIKAAIMLVKETAPHLKRGASVVFISSYAAFNPSEPLAIYAVSKTAVVGLTKALAVELGPAGIRVNCVAPGDTLSKRPRCM